MAGKKRIDPDEWRHWREVSRQFREMVERREARLAPGTRLNGSERSDSTLVVGLLGR